MLAKILYIEDDQIAALIMRKLMEKEGIQTDIVHTGKACITQALENDYDLFLIDIHLGYDEMNGIEVFNQLKEMSKYQNTPMFAITAFYLSSDKNKYLDLGFDTYYHKPIKHHILIRDIKQYLNI